MPAPITRNTSNNAITVGFRTVLDVIISSAEKTTKNVAFKMSVSKLHGWNLSSNYFFFASVFLVRLYLFKFYACE
jgi:hypothetical protein